jgi:hypothetical protein
MSVVFNPRRSLQRLRGFVQWLSKHAALVKSITASVAVAAAAAMPGGDAEPGPDEEPWASHIAGAQQLLQEALQAAAEMPELGTAALGSAATATADLAANSAAAAAAAAGLATAVEASVAVPQQQQQQLGWRLAGFSSNLPAAPTLLSVLPAHSLTTLSLKLVSGTAATRASVELTQLARLTRLQQLRLEGRKLRGRSKYRYNVPDGCFEGVEQLRSLTSLRVSGYWSGMRQQLEALLALPLPLQLLESAVDDEIDGPGQVWFPRIVHLTQLTELIMPTSMPPGAALPPSLRRLDVQLSSDFAPMLQLQHLTIVRIGRDRDTTPSGAIPHTRVLQLAQLPSLQTLALHYYGEVESAAAAAQTWPLLPQLRELRLVRCYHKRFNMQHVAKIVAGAAAATGLTSLQLTFEGLPPTTAALYEEPASVAACATLAGLTGLRQLVLEELCLAPGDAVFLTALSGLTALDLSGISVHQKCDGSGGEVAVTALAGSLQLRHLEMQHCGVDLSSMEVMTAIGQLRQLTSLLLAGNSGLTEQGLMQLTGLTRLQHLRVGSDAGVTSEVLGRFWQQCRLSACGWLEGNQL